MADQKKFDFTLHPETIKDGQVTIKILEGAPEPYNIPEAINVTCTLESVNDWITNAAQAKQVNPDNAVLILDYESLTATLHLNPRDKRAGKITGSAVLSQDYKDLKINAGASNGGFTKAQFESVIKLKRVCFPDLTQHAVLLSAVKNFSAKFSGDIQNANNNRGSKNVNFNKQYDVAEMPERIKVSLQIFKGTTLQTFWVDICMDTPSENSVVFWLESMEVEEAKRKATYEMMDKIKDNYTKFGIVVMQQ